MTSRAINKIGSLRGELVVPADKSVSHRSMMLGAIASGKSVVRNFLRAEDPLSTMAAMRLLGASIVETPNQEVIIDGKGLAGLREAAKVIDCGNSGTTIRLLSGLIAGLPFYSVLTGDDSIRQRPMARVIKPLQQMGAQIWSRKDQLAPLAIQGTSLKAIDYLMPFASAQVKSCVLFAGLSAQGVTRVTEPEKTRDHTERMLRAMGAAIEISGLTVSISGGNTLSPFEISVPSDFSSAAFFMAAAQMVPQSEVIIRRVGINPTRAGFLDILRAMGAQISLENTQEVSGEPIADLICTAPAGLKAIQLGKREVSLTIDEFPILCVLATQAEGITQIRGAQELRVKESDRIRSMVNGLQRMGVRVEELDDGVAIHGKAKLRGAPIESHHDHRIAMAFAVAGLIADGETIIDHPECVDISFPNFFDHLERLARR